MTDHHYEDLIVLFEQCFGHDYNTRLVRGCSEPEYRAASSASSHNQIIFAHGFFRSALHECAHWLIAGMHRRQLDDYGYWYEADGRNRAQQSEFEKVEVMPQALEWILTKACNHSFQVSIDNLGGESTDPEPFKRAVYTKVLSLQVTGLSDRAEYFRYTLAGFYDAPLKLADMVFEYAEL